MDIHRNHLALFLAVAKAGSISGGAAAARISQPAVSRQVSLLEGALGVRLLDRLPRGCRLTQAGELLAEHARRLESAEREAARAIEEYRGLQRGRLSVGASQTIGGYLLPGLLARFRKEHPRIDLHVEIGNTLQVRRGLLEGTVEAALTEGTEEPGELDSRVFMRDELVAIAPPGHRLLRRRAVTARELCREPFVVREEGSGTRDVAERALRRKGLRPFPAAVLASPEAIKNAVAAGLGVAFISRLVVALEVRAGELGVVRLADLRIPRPLHLQRQRHHQASPVMARFLELVNALDGAAAAPRGSSPAAAPRRR